MNNLIAEAIQWAGMAPQGVVTGCMGAALSLFYINGTELNVKKSFAVLLSGIVLGGYGFPIVTEKTGWSLPVVAGINIIGGFIAADLFASIRTASPTFTNWVISRVGKFLKIKSGDNGNHGTK